MSYAKLGKDWTEILIANDKFIDAIQKKMVDGITTDDVLMNIVAVISNICQQA